MARLGLTLAKLIPLAALLTACEDEQLCTLELAIVKLTVEPRDAATGEPVCSANVLFCVSACLPPSSQGPGCLYNYETPSAGPFIVKIQAEGYRPLETEPIVIAVDECGKPPRA